MLEFVFLGTSAGSPTRLRNVSGLAVRLSQRRDWFLIDAGEATQHRLLTTSLSPAQCVGVFITHAHGDHCYGLPGLISSLSLAGRQSPLTVWGPDAVLRWLTTTIDLTGLHPTFPLDLRSTATEPTLVWDDHLIFHARRLDHQVVTHAFDIEAHRRQRSLDPVALDALGVSRGPQWGALQRGETIEVAGSVITPDQVSTLVDSSVRAICGGDNATPDILAPHVAGLDLLIHEATYGQAAWDQAAPRVRHSSVTQVAQFAQRSGIPNLILTHFSPRYHADLSELAQEARAHYDGICHLAADGDTFTLSPASPGPARLVFEQVSGRVGGPL